MTRRSARRPKTEKHQTVALPVEDIVPNPDQPRRTFAAEAISSLAHSLLETGQIGAILVRPGPAEGKYIIVVGERRWRAAKEVGLSHIECVIRYDVDEQKARELQFAENYQREDIPPLEQARSWKDYREKYGISQRELSRRTGIPQHTISDRETLLALPLSVHAQIERGEIGPYEAVKISTLPADKQGAVAQAVSCGTIGGRVLEKLVKLARAAPEKSVQDIIGELVSPEAVRLSEGSVADLSRPCDEIGTESTAAKTPAEADLLLAAVRQVGVSRQKACPDFKKGGCSIRLWKTEESIPAGIGEPVKDNEGWRVKPSAFFCALCAADVEDRLLELESQLITNPLSGLQLDFNCDCGVQDKIAVTIKCTNCGKKTWWGGWPKK